MTLSTPHSSTTLTIRSEAIDPTRGLDAQVPTTVPESIFDGVGTKNPTIHVIDSLMGMGKSTALIAMIKADAIAQARAREEQFGVRLAYNEKLGVTFKVPPMPERRWMVIVPTLAEVDRYVAALSSFGALFEMPNESVHGRKMLHLLRLVEEGRNIVATHALFNQLSRQVYKAIEAGDYTLVIDEEIEVVRPFELPPKKTKHLFDKGYVSTDPATRRVSWNSKDHPISTFPFRTEIPKLCEAGHLVQSTNGLLIVETPAEFLRCFDEVWVATYMFHGAPMRAYLEANHFPIEMLTVTRDARTGRRHIVPLGATKDEANVKAELRRLITVDEGRRNVIGANRHGKATLNSGWFNTDVRDNGGKGIAALACSVADFIIKRAGSDRSIWTVFSGHEERMRVRGLKTDSEKDGEAYGFLAFNTRATNAYRNVEALAYPVNVFQHGSVASYFHEQGVATSEDLYAISTLVQWLWRSRIRKEPRESITVYLPSERMRGLFLEWLWSDSTAEFVEEKMEGANKALKISRADTKGRRWLPPKSMEPGFEKKVKARIDAREHERKPVVAYQAA